MQQQRPVEWAFVAIAGRLVAVDDEEVAFAMQGQLRMVPDEDFGGAVQMMCHDCWHGSEPTCDDDDCEWLAFQTADEWAEERQAYCEAVAEAKAEAHAPKVLPDKKALLADILARAKARS